MSLAANISAALRAICFSWVNSSFLASCWVRVLPPSARERVRRSAQSARTMAAGSMPWCLSNRLSSTEMTASI